MQATALTDSLPTPALPHTTTALPAPPTPQPPPRTQPRRTTMQKIEEHVITCKLCTRTDASRRSAAGTLSDCGMQHKKRHGPHMVNGTQRPHRTIIAYAAQRRCGQSHASCKHSGDKQPNHHGAQGVVIWLPFGNIGRGDGGVQGNQTKPKAGNSALKDKCAAIHCALQTVVHAQKEGY